ncbi:CGNR zinc finger domain-containing protein [Streptomyces sp. NPDC048248]|uniref:CGNR zinc finger domain-containing protein n=1 Tax=Streptomyces sp. NPDC048248 TaxID=3365523 RepID=UPI003715F0C9
MIKRCEQRTCGGLFVDSSRGRRRRWWCSKATCGNKVKKANLKAARDGAEAGHHSGWAVPSRTPLAAELGALRRWFAALRCRGEGR